MDKQKTYILFFLLFSQFLFGQVTYTFTNCGQTGRFGPSQSQVNSAYFGTTLDGKVTSNNGIQYWTVQETGVYTFEVWGAKGGDSNYGQNHHSGGYGATMKGEFILAEGEIIKILVGQKGESGSSNACGGGGSYVANQYDIPLIIAGGGGGGNVDGQGEAGSSLTGNNGNGGGGGYWGGGGGGFYSNGGGDNHGMSFLNGGNGGGNNFTGGFGGGGGGGTSSSGGGGGYYGGNAGGSFNYSGGGGGSFNSGSNQNNSSGVNPSHGWITVTNHPSVIEANIYPIITNKSYFEFSSWVLSSTKLINNVNFINNEIISYHTYFTFTENIYNPVLCFKYDGFYEQYGQLADSLETEGRLLSANTTLPEDDNTFYLLWENVLIDTFTYSSSNYDESLYYGISLERINSTWYPSFGNGTPGRENGKGRISLPQDANPFYLNLLPHFDNPVADGDVSFSVSPDLETIVYPSITADSILVVTPLWHGNDHLTITAYYEDGTQQERRMLVSLNNVFLDVPSQTTEFATIDTLDLNTWFSRMPQYGVFTFSVSSSDSTIVAPSIVQDTLLVLQNHWFGQVDLTLTITSNNDGSYIQTFPVVVPNPFASIIPNQIITDDTSQTHNLIQWFPHPVSGDVSLSVSSSNTDIVQTTLVQDTLIQLDVLNDASSIYGFTDVIIWANYPFSHSVSDTFVLTHSPGNQLVINEIHYNPAGSQGSDSEFEFIELSNSSNHTIRLENTLLSNEINFGFSETNAILPDSFVVVARDRDALLAWYPNLNSDIVFEGFTELLSNTNGSIKLTFNGYALDSLTYSDTDPWPSGADGIGPSVELVNQTLNNEYGENWQVSTSTGGTPGYQNSVYDIQVPTWSQSPPNLVFDEDADTTLAFSIWYNIVTDNSPDSLLVFSFLNTGVIHPLVNGDSVNFTIDANWNGETDIGVRVSDGALFSEETIHIIVNPVNDAPTITAINDTSYVEDNSLNFVLTSTDIDSDNLVYSAFSDTTAISVTVSDSLISFTSSLNWNGSSLITAMVSDGEYSDSTNFTLTVNPVNDAPTITVITDTTFNEDDLLSFVLSSFDIDEDDVSYFAFTDTSAVQVSITDSLLTITTNANWNGSSLIIL